MVVQVREAERGEHRDSWQGRNGAPPSNPSQRAIMLHESVEARKGSIVDERGGV